jgi:anti-sigma factor RsiW
MADNHVTKTEIEQFIENQIDEQARAAFDAHFAGCATCRARVTREKTFVSALRVLPRENPPNDLALRIGAAVDLRLSQDRVRRERMPLIFVATLFSSLLVIWFGLEVVIASEENGMLDFLNLLTSSSDLGFSPDTLLAFVEAIPISEIALTLLSLVTCIVLAQQLVETIRPQTAQFR